MQIVSHALQEEVVDVFVDASLSCSFSKVIVNLVFVFWEPEVGDFT